MKFETNDQVVDFLIDIFNSKGDELYGGEEVTQLQHGLQAAYFAEQENASNDLVVAALLHDIGHLLHELPDNATEQGIDDVHEALGAQFLATYFNDLIVDVVKLHVEAKRYLCLVEPGYYSTLSSTSKASLLLQGGIMSSTEKELFEHHTYYQEAVMARKWDDLAKDPAIVTRPIESYKTNIFKALKNKN
jgi:phosphonate degradation associated HDIG domain protein